MSNPQSKGNFFVGLNRAKQPGSKQPDFTGRISAPDADYEFPVSVWAGKDKHGRTYFSGKVRPTPISNDPQAQIDALTAAQPVHDHTDVQADPTNITVKPYELKLFHNVHRTPEHPNRPPYWGRVNMGDGSPPLAVGVWLSQDRNGNPILRGETSVPFSKADRADAPDAIALADHEPDATPPPAPKPRTGRSGR